VERFAIHTDSRRPADCDHIATPGRTRVAGEPLERAPGPNSAAGMILAGILSSARLTFVSRRFPIPAGTGH
jgi:hypothetical protein